MPRAILFDIDGTLVDTRAASWELVCRDEPRSPSASTRARHSSRSSRATSSSRWRGCAPRQPPIRSGQAPLHGSSAHALPAGDDYRLVDVVRALAPHCALAVLSTIGIEAIRRILVDAGIATCFSHVLSGEVQPRKSESMRRFLRDYRYAAQRCCSPAYREEPTGDDALESSDCVLVTDTVGDVAEAKEVGIATVGVAWGTHSERQLLDAGAKKVGRYGRRSSSHGCVPRTAAVRHAAAWPTPRRGGRQDRPAGRRPPASRPAAPPPARAYPRRGWPAARMPSCWVHCAVSCAVGHEARTPHRAVPGASPDCLPWHANRQTG